MDQTEIRDKDFIQEVVKVQTENVKQSEDSSNTFAMPRRGWKKTNMITSQNVARTGQLQQFLPNGRWSCSSSKSFERF